MNSDSSPFDRSASSEEVQAPPSRPTVTKQMYAEAAAALAKRNRWDDGQADDLASVYEHHMNGYELAKELERSCGWDIDASDVDALDDMFSEVQRVHQNACVIWAQENNIQPPLPVGTMTTRGEIAGIYEHGPATYRIREHGETKEGRFLLVKFEDAKVSPNPEGLT